MNHYKKIHSAGARSLVLAGLILLAGVSLLAQRGPGPQSGAGCPWCNRDAGPAPAVEPLTAPEVQSLLLMREEEKLARDVYVNLYQRWKLNVFANIARSEQRHFDAVGVLLARYGVTDPALETAGTFTNATLQTLYGQLMAKGILSLKDALEVGVAIEEQDIDDLEAAIAATGKTDIKRVYANLLSGSLSHLAAFTSHLQVTAVP